MLSCLFLSIAPLVRGGHLHLPEFDHTVRINRIQLEQDSGKNVHDLSPFYSFVDLNRAGAALMEIVSEPDIRSKEQAAAYVRKLSEILQALHTCRAHMEEGTLRCDVNVSVRRKTDAPHVFGERVEIKNVNTIRGLMRAIDFETERQIQLNLKGKPVSRETRAFDARTGTTILMR